MQKTLFVTICGSLVTLCGVVVMLAWLVHAAWLATAFQNGIAMVFSTALAFALAGLAILLSEIFPRAHPVARKALCAAIAVLAGIALLENLISIDLGIDLVSLHSWVGDQNPQPGRMAPNTAVAFLFVAAGLALRQHRASGISDFSQNLLPAAVVTLGALGILSNLFRLDMAYDWYHVPRMAMPTGAGFLLLGSATWLDRRRDEKRRPEPVLQGEGRIYAFLGGRGGDE